MLEDDEFFQRNLIDLYIRSQILLSMSDKEGSIISVRIIV